VLASTEPTAGLLLLHVPPALASVRAIVEPVHTLDKPVIPLSEVTVTTVVARQPPPDTL